MKPKILIVDDDKTFIKFFIAQPEARPYEFLPAYTPGEALEILGRGEASLVISDVVFGRDEDGGIKLAAAVREDFPEIPIILLTAFGTVEKAVAAIKEGAYHYFQKPLSDTSTDLLWTAIREALKLNRAQRRVKSYRIESELNKKLAHPPILGESEAIRAVLLTIDKVAEFDMDVLVSGETGTGKELVAREIHTRSARKDGSFLPLTCGVPSDSTLESELFGHEKGAFTGATEKRIGAFEAVDGGVLFLDEISDASQDMQRKLMRVLETREYKPVGGTFLKRTDFRLVAATNQFLEKEIEAGRFRKDLFFRLKVARIHIAPLRDRKEDIVPIANYYLDHFKAVYHKEIKGFSEDAELAMVSYDWPGNVRELKHAVEGAFIHFSGDVLTAHDMFPIKCAHEYPPSFKLKDVEKFCVKLVLERCGYNKAEAAKILDVSRKTLYEKIKRYNLEKNK